MQKSRCCFKGLWHLHHLQGNSETKKKNNFHKPNNHSGTYMQEHTTEIKDKSKSKMTPHVIRIGFKKLFLIGQEEKKTLKSKIH